MVILRSRKIQKARKAKEKARKRWLRGVRRALFLTLTVGLLFFFIYNNLDYFLAIGDAALVKLFPERGATQAEEVANLELDDADTATAVKKRKARKSTEEIDAEKEKKAKTWSAYEAIKAEAKEASKARRAEAKEAEAVRKSEAKRLKAEALARKSKKSKNNIDDIASKHSSNAQQSEHRSASDILGAPAFSDNPQIALSATKTPATNTQETPQLAEPDTPPRDETIAKIDTRVATDTAKSAAIKTVVVNTVAAEATKPESLQTPSAAEATQWLIGSYSTQSTRPIRGRKKKRPKTPQEWVALLKSLPQLATSTADSLSVTATASATTMLSSAQTSMLAAKSEATSWLKTLPSLVTLQATSFLESKMPWLPIDWPTTQISTDEPVEEGDVSRVAANISGAVAVAALDTPKHVDIAHYTSANAHTYDANGVIANAIIVDTTKFVGSNRGNSAVMSYKSAPVDAVITHAVKHTINQTEAATIAGMFLLPNISCKLADRDDLRINMSVELFYNGSALHDEVTFKRNTLTVTAGSVVRRFEYGAITISALRSELLNAFNELLRAGKLSGIDIQNFSVEQVALQ